MDLSNYTIPKTKITNERQAILKEFQDEINLERIDTKWEPLTGKAVAMKLAHVKKKEDLYAFLSQCRRYKNEKGSFSRAFFGALKVITK